MELQAWCLLVGLLCPDMYWGCTACPSPTRPWHWARGCSWELLSVQPMEIWPWTPWQQKSCAQMGLSGDGLVQDHPSFSGRACAQVAVFSHVTACSWWNLQRQNALQKSNPWCSCTEEFISVLQIKLEIVYGFFDDNSLKAVHNNLENQENIEEAEGAPGWIIWVSTSAV